MKNINFLVFIICIFQNYSIAQTVVAGQPEAPPTGFRRGLYVDCANEIINDMAVSNNTKKTELENYVTTNFINYLVLFKLDNGHVIGNATLESYLSTLIIDLRSLVPDIEIGVACSDQNFFVTTSSLYLFDWEGPYCYPEPVYERAAHFDEVMNPEQWLNDPLPIGEPIDELYVLDEPENLILKTAELYKSIVQTARYTESEAAHSFDICTGAIDFIYVEIEYWTEATPAAGLVEYNKFKDCLQLAKDMRCSYNCISNIDCEFYPQDGKVLG